MGCSNERFEQAARALLHGERFPPFILAGRDYDDLVCLEGNLRLTAYAVLISRARPNAFQSTDARLVLINAANIDRHACGTIRRNEDLHKWKPRD